MTEDADYTLHVWREDQPTGVFMQITFGLILTWTDRRINRANQSANRLGWTFMRHQIIRDLSGKPHQKCAG